MNQPILLKYKGAMEYTGILRLSPEAELVARRLKARTSLSTKAIVSRMIL